MKRAICMARAFAMTALAVSACGCALFRHEVPASAVDERRVYQAKRLDLQDGVTTQADVERLLGAPDFRLSDDAALVAYRWQLVRYEEDLHSALVEDDDDVNDRSATKVIYHSLLLDFDDAGVVRRHRACRHKVAYGGPPPLPQLLSAWANEGRTR